MNQRPPEQNAPPPIRGSWEDLIERATQLDPTESDLAIDLFQRVWDGLRRLPPAQLLRANRRLQVLLRTAMVGLIRCYNARDRWQDSLALFGQATPLFDEESDQEFIRVHVTDILLLAGHTDDSDQPSARQRRGRRCRLW